MSDAVLEQLLGTLIEEITSRVAEELDRRGYVLGRAPSPFFTIAEAADYLRCDRQRIYNLLSAGKLTRHKDGSRVLVSRAELDEYLGTDPVASRLPPVSELRSARRGAA